MHQLAVLCGLLVLADSLVRVPLRGIPALAQSPTQTIDDAAEDTDVIYVGEVEVGLAAHKFSLLFDTGSSPMWLMTRELCRGLCERSSRRLYNASAPFCETRGLSPFTDSYGGGRTAGCYIQEPVSLGSLTSPLQEVALVFALDRTMMQFDMDGILGLAFPGDEFYPLLQNVFRRYAMPPVFCLSLRKGSRGSHFLVGGSDPSLYSGRLWYVPILPDTVAGRDPVYHHWTINLDKVAVGGGHVLGYNVRALLDTGTALVAAPKEQLLHLLEYFNNVFQGELLASDGEFFEYQVPCWAHACQLDFHVGNFTLTLSQEELVQQGSSHSEANSTCRIRLMTAPVWVLGTVFHRKYYVEYDMANRRVGFANYRQ